jgi:hypothetical protein
MTTWPTVMVTGHRPQHLSPSVRPWVQSELARLAVKLRDEYGMTTGISGMALGPDQWWADDVTKAGVKLWAHVPFPQQPDKWKPEDRAEWSRLLGLAADVTTYGSRYDVRLLHARNDGMIEPSAAAIAVRLPWKTGGGTVDAMRKLMALGKPIINVNPAAKVTTIRLPQRAAA